MARGGRCRWALGALLALALAAPTRGYESDQYSHRLEPIEDALPVLDRAVNETLARVARRHRGAEDRMGIALGVWRELGGLYWADRIERFVVRTADIEKLPQRRRTSIFAGAPFWATRVNFVFGVGRTFRLAGTLVGSDKLGHFFSQGLKYFRSHLSGWSERRVAGRGRFNERWLFGQATTSNYSNADLVANWEGYRFYRSLFENGIVAGKGPIVRFRGGRAEIARPFTWADHVNDFWDEALNPSYVSKSLARYLERRLPELCADYRRAPERFRPVREAELRARYEGIGLRENLRFRMDHVCAPGWSSTVALESEGR
ncbi:MAG: hypothetical protein F9K18_06815 [Thermoanaerobaculia bacterium]|nr:MAG: hypothetical protein F9K18_06815 [Thermoanaerobaculia bacterium]